MKTILLFLMGLMSLVSNAQTAESPALKLSFVTYTEAGYTVQIQNKLSVDASVDIVWEGGSRTIQVPVGVVATELLSASYSLGSTIKVRTPQGTTVAGGNNGWLSLQVPALTLPIKLYEFAVVSYTGEVQLRFRASFDSGEKMEVQRSSDGLGWVSLATVTDPAQTAYVDRAPLQGRSFYRLKLIEGTGYAYSKVAAVSRSGSTTGTFQVYTASGAFFRSLTAQSVQELRNQIRALPHGVYVLSTGERFVIL